MAERVDLDQLERLERLAEAAVNTLADADMHRFELHSGPQIILALIAELRAARRVVEASKKYHAERKRYADTSRPERAKYVLEALDELDKAFAAYHEAVTQREAE